MVANLATAYRNEGRFEDAARYYERALIVAPPGLHFKDSIHQEVYRQWRADTLEALAEARGRMGDRRGALEAVTLALRLDASRGSAWMRKANQEWALGMYEEALKSLDQVLHYLPDLPSAVYTKALIFFDLNRIAVGRAALLEAVALDPIGVCARARIYVKKANPDVVARMRDIPDGSCAPATSAAPPP
jgi:tetratricopeptide (TPR) repeat protein